MCGIVGAVCKTHFGFFKKHVDIFYSLLKADEVRGEDSTGVIYIENDTGFGIMKEALQASWCLNDFYSHDMTKNIIRKGKGFIGHNRKATVGRVTEETAHPFVVDNTFAMVHNGTLRGHKHLKDTEVDSEALAHHLAPLLEADTFDKDSFEKEIGTVNGAFAIASYSQKKNSVFLMRNAERPLSFVETDDAFYWASEALMLLWILSRNGYDCNKYKIEQVPGHQLLQLSLEDNKVTRTDFVPKKATPPTHTTYPSGGGKTVAGTSKQNSQPSDVISKNEYKRLRRRWIGTRRTFWADDYVEKAYPKTIAMGETAITLLGAPDGAEFSGYNVTVRADIDIGKLFQKNVSEQDILEACYHGRIADVLWDKHAHELTLVMEDVRPLDKTIVNHLVQGKWNAQTPSVH